MIQEKFRKYFEKSWVLLLGTGYILRDVLALHIKVPGHTGKNAITEGDSECILFHISDNLKVLSCMGACRQKADMIRRVPGNT